jgi:hypothetical protein
MCDIVLGARLHGLHSVHLCEMGQTDDEVLVAKVGPCIRKLTQDVTIIMSIATDNASNLGMALDSAQLEESRSQSLGQPTCDVDCGCHRTNLAVRDVECSFQPLADLKLRHHRLSGRRRSSEMWRHMEHICCTVRAPLIQDINCMIFCNAVNDVDRCDGEIGNTLSKFPLQEFVLEDLTWEHSSVAL